LQPAQARIERPANVQGGQFAIVGPAAHLAVDLGGNDSAVAPAPAAGEPVADDGFGFARLTAVAVGGVEEVNTRIVGEVHDVVRVFLGGSGPEIHRAKTKSGDLKAGTAKIGEVHSGSLSPSHSGLRHRHGLIDSAETSWGPDWTLPCGAALLHGHDAELASPFE
jgi:hypothetical protein